MRRLAFSTPAEHSWRRKEKRKEKLNGHDATLRQAARGKAREREKGCQADQPTNWLTTKKWTEEYREEGVCFFLLVSLPSEPSQTKGKEHWKGLWNFHSTFNPTPTNILFVLSALAFGAQKIVHVCLWVACAMETWVRCLAGGSTVGFQGQAREEEPTARGEQGNTAALGAWLDSYLQSFFLFLFFF